MAIADQMIDQAYSDLKATCGGVRSHAFRVGDVVGNKDVHTSRHDKRWVRR